MYKLLNAGFSRLKKNKLFFGIIFLIIVISCLMVSMQYRDVVVYEVTIKTEQLMLSLSTYIGIFIAVFVSFFIGREYSDGTIRNKIVTGHKRKNIYLSNMIINTVAGIIMYFVYLLVVAMLGIPLFGGIKMTLSIFAIMLFDILITIAVYSAIFSFVSLLCSNKTITAVISILIVFAMITVSMTLFNIVTARETRQVIKLDENGEMQLVEEPNPKYPSEFKRNVCKTILEIIPTGQALVISEGYETNFYVLPLYSLGVIIIFNGLGLYLFDKKELN